MKKRGTGWIPDYPDQSDYTLEKDSKELSSNRIQNQANIAAIEALRKNFLDYLKLIRSDNTEERTLISTIKENIEKEAQDGVEFITVYLRDVFKEGIVASDILLIRNYIQKIDTYIGRNDGESLLVEQLNPTNMELTKEILDIANHYVGLGLGYSNNIKKYKQVKDYICFDDIICLEYLSNWAILEIAELWPRLYENWKEYLRENPSFFKETQCQYTKEMTSIKNTNKITKFWGIESTKFLVYCKSLYHSINELITIGENFNSVSDIKFLQETEKQIDDLEQELDLVISDKGSFDNLKKKNPSTSNNEATKERCKLISLFLKSIQTLKELLDSFKQSINHASECYEYRTWTHFLMKIREINQSFKKINDKAYKYFMPLIPPQLFERSELPLDSPIDHNLLKVISKEIVGKQKKDKVDKLINPIAEIVAQMLMPMGQCTNLSDSVSKALGEIKSSLMNPKKDEQLDITHLIQEVLQQQRLSKEFDPISESILKKMDKKALKQNLSALDSKFSEEYESSENQRSALDSKFSKEDESSENQGVLMKLQKPLFEVDLKEDQKQPLYIGKQIQFPIPIKLNDEILELRKKNHRNKSGKEHPKTYFTLPEFVDLSYRFSPIEDQGRLNSCTAHAGIALLEYFQKKCTGTYIDVSPLFLYKVTRNLMQNEGDSGASMRDTMKAMVAFGVCPEDYWSYNEADFDVEPPAFCYSFAESFKALKYFRLDYGTIAKPTLLAQAKVLLTSELPCAFGFTLYSSVYEDSNFDLGHIPFPTGRDKVVGGHVVVAVGYHDHKVIKNSNGDEFEGALLIRNSWGSKWGQGGYGWMPYEYVTKGLTADWWSLLKAEWLASGSFGAGVSAWDPSSGGTDGGHPPTL